MPPSGVDYASEFLNGYAPVYVVKQIRIVSLMIIVNIEIPFIFVNGI